MRIFPSRFFDRRCKCAHDQLIENRIDRVHLEERIFPFNQPIERGPGRLWNMEKDNRLFSGSGSGFIICSVYLHASAADQANHSVIMISDCGYDFVQ